MKIDVFNLHSKLTTSREVATISTPGPFRIEEWEYADPRGVRLVICNANDAIAEMQPVLRPNMEDARAEELANAARIVRALELAALAQDLTDMLCTVEARVRFEHNQTAKLHGEPLPTILSEQVDAMTVLLQRAAQLGLDSTITAEPMDTEAEARKLATSTPSREELLESLADTVTRMIRLENAKEGHSADDMEDSGMKILDLLVGLGKLSQEEGDQFGDQLTGVEKLTAQEPTVQERRDNARVAILNTTDAKTDGLLPEYAADLLANVFHLADEKGWKVEDLISTAKMHWEDERPGEYTEEHLDALNEFLRGFAETGGIDDDAANQWAGHSDALTDDERRALEKGGYEAGKQQGEEYAAFWATDNCRYCGKEIPAGEGLCTLCNERELKG